MRIKRILFTFLTLFFLSTSLYAQEDLQKVRINDFSGGQNSYDLADIIQPNQGKLVKNAIISKKGQLSKRKGQSLFAEDLSDATFVGIGRFDVDVNTSYIMVASGPFVLRSLISPASWVYVNASSEGLDPGQSSLLSTGFDTEFIQANALLAIVNGQDRPAFYNGSSWESGYNSSASPPICATAEWLRNYMFYAGNPTNPDWVYFSNNLTPKTLTSTDLIRVNTGDGQRIIRLKAFRLNELIVYKQRSIYILDITGDPGVGGANWTVQPITREVGCIAPRSVVNLGNDHWFLSSDPIAIRSLLRTSFDKILIDMVSQPIQDIFDGTGETTINKTYINKACAILFDDKYILAIPTGTSNFNNYVVMYDFISKSWSTVANWYPAAWVVFNNNLYYIDAQNGRVIQCFSGTTGDFASDPTVVSASGPTVGIEYEYVSRNMDFDNIENFKMPDALELEFEPSGDYNADVYIELDDGGYQNIGTISLKGNAPTLPINLPFNLGAGGIARKTFQIQKYGEFKKIKVRVVQNGLGELCNLHRITAFSDVKEWRRE